MKIINVIRKIYYISYFFIVIVSLAALEQLWFAWYLLTDFNQVTTVKRIAANKYCPKTVLHLYEYHRLNSNNYLFIYKKGC